MGLLTKANNAGSPALEKKSGGLLAKISGQTRKPSSFQQWAKLNGFEHCGIFMPVSGMMVMMHAYQINTNTIASSISSKDFWNKNLEQSNKWYTYNNSEESFKIFMQFFDLELSTHISSVSLLKFNIGSDFNILMSFNTNSKNIPSKCDSNFIENIITENDFSKQDLLEKCESLKHISNKKHLVELPLEAVIKMSIRGFELPEAKIRKCIMNCIYEELFYTLSSALDSNNICKYLNIYNIKLVLTFCDDTDDILILSHISLLFSSIIPELKPDNLKFIHSNVTGNIKEVVNFIN